MSPATIAPEMVHAEPAEEQGLRDLHEQIVEIYRHPPARANLVSAEGREVEIPASAFHALQLIVEGIANGQTMMLVPRGKELTTQTAADILHVSRPHLVKLLEEGEIPHHYVGSHRRIKFEDVMAYRTKRNEHRRQKLTELTRLSEEAEGGYE